MSAKKQSKSKTRKAKVKQAEPLEQPITFETAVVLGKKLAAAIGSSKLALGELADGVETSYGEASLAQFADKIRVHPETLKRYRGVARAYRGVDFGATSPSFGAMAALQDHPDRVTILKENPDLTVEAAREMMRAHRAANDQAAVNTMTAALNKAHNKTKAQETVNEAATNDQPKERWIVIETRRWFDDAMEAARKTFKFGHPPQERLDPDVLRAAVADLDQLVSALRKSTTATTTLADAIEDALANSIVPAALPPPMFDEATSEAATAD